MCQHFDRAAERAADYANRKRGGIAAAERFLLRAWPGGTFGIEGATVADRTAEYINVGESYGTTVVCENGHCIVSSWGDWTDSAENEHCADNDVVRCGYCSAFAPIADSGWRATICDSCGRNVSTGELP